MPLEFLTEHRQAVDEALAAYQAVEAAGERFFAAVTALPPDLQFQVLTEVTQNGKVFVRHPQAPADPCSCQKTPIARVRFPKPKSPVPRHDKLPNPRQVVLAILKQNPDGVTLRDIQEQARGLFATASRDPDHVVRTIVSQLRKEAFIDRDEEGLHRPTPFFPT